MDYNDKMRYTTGNDANILLAHLFSYEINADEGMKKKIFWHKRVNHNKGILLDTQFFDKNIISLCNLS